MIGKGVREGKRGEWIESVWRESKRERERERGREEGASVGELSGRRKKEQKEW